MQPAKRASFEFSLKWKSNTADHCDRYYLEKVDFWRDIFPGNMADELPKLQPGELHQEQFPEGALVPQYSQSNIVSIPSSDLGGNQKGSENHLWVRRYYPVGMVHHHFNTFKENYSPFLLTSINEFTATADCNHPLAKYPLQVQAHMVHGHPAAIQRGGSLNDIAELMTNDGPGMQMPPLLLPHNDETWFDYPFHRENEDEDTSFYTTPRMVHHLDSTAREQVRKFYTRILTPGARILDLMGSHDSHLSQEFRDSEITGLGLNEAELAANDMLKRRVIQNLNKLSVLPFDDNYFDTVICTVSIEYLTQPYEILTQVARVLRPGGTCVITVSDRWFPGKQIAPWGHLHSFERQGMVLGFLLRGDQYEDLHTESLRGLPRPAHDKHYQVTQLSDPLFFVWGKVKK